MKTLKFTIPACWPRILAGQKRQTIRLRFVPDYQVNDPLGLVARSRELGMVRDVPMADANVVEIFPVMLGEIDDEMGKADGFETGADCIAALARLNSVKETRIPRTWAFVIRWEIVKLLVKDVGEIIAKLKELEKPVAPAPSPVPAPARVTGRLETFLGVK